MKTAIVISENGNYLLINKDGEKIKEEKDPAPVFVFAFKRKMKILRNNSAAGQEILLKFQSGSAPDLT